MQCILLHSVVEGVGRRERKERRVGRGKRRRMEGRKVSIDSNCTPITSIQSELAICYTVGTV